MKTIGEIIKLSAQFLEERGIKRARREVEEILAHVLQKKRIDLYMHFELPMQERELEMLRSHLKRRAKNEPVAYILGEIPFFHCSILTTSSALIPRQETEILLSKVSEKLEKQNLEGKIAWDICTGSGCLGIGLKKKFPVLEISLSDLSADALELAKKNAERNGVAASFYQGDLLKPFTGKKADFILCNPPYVREEEYAALDASVRDFEPRLALVGGSSGLEFYARLAKELPAHLNPHAQLFLEIGTGQGEQVLALFQESCWKEKRIEKDWAGHDRFFFLEFQ